MRLSSNCDPQEMNWDILKARCDKIGVIPINEVRMNLLDKECQTGCD